MATVLKNTAMTFEDFCTLVKDGQKADLIDGVIYMASPDNTDANQLATWLLRLIGDYIELRELGGQLLMERVAFRLDDYNAPEPDLAYVTKERQHTVKRGAVEGPPDLAVEIISPDSVERDYHKKRELYRKAGVREYWILDEPKEQTLFLRLDSRGAYREVKPKNGVFRSQVLPGFWLKTEWLWQQPLPKVLSVLREILDAGE